MASHTRFTPILAVVSAFALAGASVARAQDTSAAARTDTAGAAVRQDTSGYGGYRNRTDTTANAGQQNAQTDTSKFKYTGPPTDTTLKAKPGAQTGPAADSGKAAGAAAFVCKDGSNAVSKRGCKAHGGVDKAATAAAKKARGEMTGAAAESTGAAPDTTRVNKKGAEGYQYHGPPTDTTLKARPGAQTGADTGAMKSDSAMKSDTGMNK
jgi:hypothetical protein